MGIFDDDDLEIREQARKEANQFKPRELNEGEVQAIFNRCLAKEDSQKTSTAMLFPSTRGYKVDAEKTIYFDTENLLKNKQNIEYLYGQLQEIHISEKRKDVNIDDFNTTYRGKHWTKDKATLLKFLYLGSTSTTLVITPFTAETNTSIISPRIKPTLSPKDPNFPAWWEQHKSEWEQ